MQVGNDAWNVGFANVGVVTSVLRAAAKRYVILLAEDLFSKEIELDLNEDSIHRYRFHASS